MRLERCGRSNNRYSCSILFLRVLICIISVARGDPATTKKLGFFQLIIFSGLDFNQMDAKSSDIYTIHQHTKISSGVVLHVFSKAVGKPCYEDTLHPGPSFATKNVSKNIISFRKNRRGDWFSFCLIPTCD